MRGAGPGRGAGATLASGQEDDQHRHDNPPHRHPAAMTPIPPGPAADEILTASLGAVMHARGRVAVVPTVGTDDYVRAALDARIAALSSWGLHFLHVERPARQAELKETALAVHGGTVEPWATLARRWPTVRVPRLPVRCDRCHDRLTGREGPPA